MSTCLAPPHGVTSLYRAARSVARPVSSSDRWWDRIATLPDISVVIADDHSANTVRDTVDSVRASCARLRSEVLLVCRRGSAAAGMEWDDPDLHVVTTAANAPVPVLWSRGIAAARGAVVALTTGHFFVSRGWAQALLREISQGAIGASGPIALASGTGLVGRAVYYLRYSAFMQPADGRAVEIPGDNAAYDRRALERHAESHASGFWEVDFHRRIRAEGGWLTFTSDALAFVGRSFTFGSFLRQRFRHGRHYGAYRVTTLGTSRLRCLLAAPLVPFVLVGRILRRAAATPGALGSSLSSLPALLPFAGAWAAGEVWGALVDSFRAAPQS